MLRAVAFRNFINFRDHQSLEFQDGPNFIVGPNASGKTALFELIRRCLSNTVNTSTSKVADQKSPAFVICKFDITSKLSDKIPIGCHVYSCRYVKHLDVDSKEIYKLVCITSTEKQSGKCYLDHYSCVGDTLKKIGAFDSNEVHTVSDELDMCLIKDEHSFDRLHKMFDIIMQQKQQRAESGGGECECILEAIHNVVVLTFPIRSPGPIQWSHTENIGKGNEHYNTASHRAEILQDLLESPDVDEGKSNQIFETIIHPLRYSFTKNSDSTITVNDGEKDLKLLKVPEGIVEAKQFSLMFAHRKYQTLMLEEPDRGMHPPMIQKLRDLVFRRYNKERKMVLVFTSHQPAMINRWVMGRMYVCRRKRAEDGKFKHSVFRLSNKIENIYQEQNTLKQMLYSESVLFVEGPTDKTIVESIFDRVLEADSLDGFSKEKILHLQKAVSGIQVIDIDGSTSYNTLKSMGKNLELPCAFLLDKDTVFDCRPAVLPKEGVRIEKWRNSTLLCVRIFLQRLKGRSKGNARDEQKEKMKKEAIDHVMKKPTEKDQTKSIQDELGLIDRDLSDVTWTTVVSFIRSVVLPETFELKKKAVEPYAIPKNMKTSKDIRDYLRDTERVFLWDSGNLEQMICKNILNLEEQKYKHDSKSTKLYPTEGEETDMKMDQRNHGNGSLLEKLFLCKKYDEGAKNPKNPIKETLKQMDFRTAENITECLLKCSEIKSLLEFLLQIEEEKGQSFDK